MKGRWLKMGFACIGMTGIMTACYGVPYDEYTVKGKVTDEEDAPINGIKISEDRNGNNYVYSDEDGTYVLVGWERLQAGTTIRAEDIDGPENGGEYSPQEIKITDRIDTDNLDFSLRKK